MDLIDALLGEHAVLYGLFDHLEDRLAGVPDIVEVGNAVSTLTAALLAHAEVEEELLFQTMKPLAPANGLTQMHDEHAEIDRILRAATMGTLAASAARNVLRALRLAREHFTREENVLFPHARQIMDADLREQLGARWAAARGVRVM